MARSALGMAQWTIRQTDFAWGLALATCACAWTWGFAAHFGTGRDARMAGMAAALAGLAVGTAGRRFVAPSAGWMLRALLAAASVVSIWILPLVSELLAGLPLAAMTSTGTLVRLLLCGLLTVSIPACLAALSFPADLRRVRATLAGCGVGLCLLPTTLMAWLDLHVATLAMATLYGVGVALATQDDESIAENPEMAEATDSPVPIWCAAVLAVCGGLVMGSSSRWAFQLFVDAPVWVFGRWGALCLGLTIGTMMALGSRKRGAWFGGLTLAACCALAVIAYPSAIRSSLGISATVSPVSLTFLMRGLIAGFLPVAAGVAIAATCGAQSRPRGAAWMLSGAGLLIGVAFAGSVGSILVASALATSGTAVVLLFLSTPRLQQALESPHPLRRTSAWGISAAVGLLAVTSMVSSGRYCPTLAARVLFHAPFRDAYVEGRSFEQMVRSDATRLLSVTEGPESTWTVWKQRDAYIHLRENGLSRGLVSLDTRIAPQSAPDVISTVLPLVLHHDPQNVLFLGMKSPAMLATSIDFPVYSIRCVEADPTIRQIIENDIVSGARTSLFADERVEWFQADPLLAARADHAASYDVIVSQDGQSLPWSNAPRWTREHFQSVARLLTDSGMFCQRLSYGDYTDRPVRELAATLRTVFPHVTLLEPLPGDLLFVCTLSEPVTANEHLVGRLDRPHVRHVLGRMGWDWSVVMGLSFVPAESLDKFAGKAATNTAANARFVTTLAPEAYRWGAKWAAVRDRMAPLQTTALQKLAKDSPELFDVSKRIEDINLASKIVGGHPDEFWEYRKSLKDRLKDRPRTAIIQVKGEEGGLRYGLHEEDTRRKEFLTALGAAVANDPPKSSLVREMASFAEPFDPLLSPFVHEEAARLYGKCQPRVAAEELLHWQHAIYYGTGNDRSVRNVVSAVELLHAAPESLADPVARWDALQSLLDVMKERWIIRAQLARSGRSKFETVDLSRSIAAAEAALGDLDTLAPEVGSISEGWNVRRKSLERDLIRELEGFRAEREAQAEQQRREAAARAANRPLPGGLPSL